MAKRVPFVLGALLVAVLALADAVFKSYAIRYAEPANGNRLSFLFDIALHKNPGIAFDIPLPFFIILPLTLVVCGLFTSFLIKGLGRGEEKTTLAAFTVIIGALGNLVDRALNGFTTDYLIFFRTSAINISDVLIVIGMLAFLWYYQSNPAPKSN